MNVETLVILGVAYLAFELKAIAKRFPIKEPVHDPTARVREDRSLPLIVASIAVIWIAVTIARACGVII